MEQREHWSGSLGFILAAAGSAIGLGNIWMFPYVAGTNGGGAFVLVYLMCVLLIGMPIMLCEIVIGRATQQSPVGAFQQLHVHGRRASNFVAILLAVVAVMLVMFQCYAVAVLVGIASVLSFIFGWGIVGIIGVVSGTVILSFYGVVGGWTIAYIAQAIAGKLSFTTPDEAKTIFDSVTLNVYTAVGCQLLFMTLCAAAIIGGIRRGIERWSKILMPILFVLIIVLILRSLTLPGAAEGVKFFLSPDISKLTMGAVLQAMGTAFFSLSLGMGVMVTYGSYLDRNRNIVSSVMAIVGLDTLIALMAGLAIFPAVFSMGFAPDGGTGLAFQILPAAFNAIFGGNGWLWSGLFFCVLFIAALTSGISILEVVASFFIDQLKWKRPLAVVVATTICSAIGVVCAVSVANWDNIPAVYDSLRFAFGEKLPASFFAMCDELSRLWLLPLGGVTISIFTGWIWGVHHAIAEMRRGMPERFIDTNIGIVLAGLQHDPNYTEGRRSLLTIAVLWGIAIRFVAPILVAIAFLVGIGWIRL
ncbi:MAG: sodium-dependent transporter [Thermoguttaceae bacterium]